MGSRNGREWRRRNRQMQLKPQNLAERGSDIRFSATSHITCLNKGGGKVQNLTFQKRSLQ
jgi:hypothetical protein